MTQPQNPGQPYVPPSAPSGAGSYTGQYQAQQPYQPQAAPSYQAPAPQPGAAGQYAPVGPAPAAPFAPATVQADSLVSNLMDTTRGFARKYGKTVFLIALAAIAISWVGDFYSAGATHMTFDSGTLQSSFNWPYAFLSALFALPWRLVEIFLIRLFIELVAGTTPANGTGGQA